MKRTLSLLALALVAPVVSCAPSTAQTTSQSTPSTMESREQITAVAAAPASANVGVSTNRALWSQMTRNLTIVADELSEADYAYRPVGTVRTFGQMFAHVAGAQRMFCAAALGEPLTGEDDIERTQTTKAGIVAALKETTTYCERAYQISDATAADPVELFGQRQTKMFALALNAVHNGEHYGNIVTYMRIKGMVPPSSRGN